MHLFCFVAIAKGVAAYTLYDSYTFDPLQHLAGIAPYFEPQVPPTDPSPPQGCNVTKAAYLVRHAAINANDFDYEEYLEPFIDKVQNHTNVNWATIPELAFLTSWVPPQLTEEEQVTRTGKLESAELGVQISYKYPYLRLPQNVYTSTAERTVQSAKGLIHGLETSDNQISLIQIYEGKEAGANSLTPYSSCPAYSSSQGSDQSKQYQTLYTAPIIARMNALTNNAFNFTANDITAMQELCGYETVIRGSSPFCSLDLFSPDEWLAFEYTNDIMYHYNTGYGNPISGVIGFPWLNSTLGLLTSSAPSEQDIYISFTHRELPPTVLVAMGLFNNTQFTTESAMNSTMPLTQINYNRAWKSSVVLPFLTNIAIEQMDCADNYYIQSQSQSGSNNGSSTDTIYYRVLLNNAPQSLPSCHDGPSESCSTSGLQSYLSERAALFEGFSARCNVSYENSTDVLSFYTDESIGNGTTVGKRR